MPPSSGLQRLFRHEHGPRSSVRSVVTYLQDCGCHVQYDSSLRKNRKHNSVYVLLDHAALRTQSDWNFLIKINFIFKLMHCTFEADSSCGARTDRAPVQLPEI
jgi:hypothetical protein